MYQKYHAQKRPKICTGCRVSEAKIYLYHGTKIVKARPHSVEWQTDSSVQKQWFMTGPCNILDMDLAHLYCIYRNCYLMYLNCGNQTLWILMTCPKPSKTKAERFHVCFKLELWCCHYFCCCCCCYCCCCCWSNLLSSAQFWTCIVFCSAKI